MSNKGKKLFKVGRAGDFNPRKVFAANEMQAILKVTDFKEEQRRWGNGTLSFISKNGDWWEVKKVA